MVRTGGEYVQRLKNVAAREAGLFTDAQVWELPRHVVAAQNVENHPHLSMNPLGLL